MVLGDDNFSLALSWVREEKAKNINFLADIIFNRIEMIDDTRLFIVIKMQRQHKKRRNTNRIADAVCTAHFFRHRNRRTKPCTRREKKKKMTEEVKLLGDSEWSEEKECKDNVVVSCTNENKMRPIKASAAKSSSNNQLMEATTWGRAKKLIISEWWQKKNGWQNNDERRR